ncbi:MAG: hypothetical protein ACE5G8_02730 [Anaerolineae bacterium]
MSKYILPAVMGILLFAACRNQPPPPPGTPVLPPAAPTPPVATPAPPQPPLAPPQVQAVPTRPVQLGRPLAEAVDFDPAPLESYVTNGYALTGYFETRFEDTAYAALYLEQLPNPELEGEEALPALVFVRFEENRAELQYPDYLNEGIEIDPAGWRDLNGDSAPDLPVLFRGEPDHWRLFSVDSDGLVVDLLVEWLSGSAAPTELRDFDGDGLFEAKIADFSWQGWAGLCPECSPQAFRIVAWHPDKRIYSDFSARYLPLYLAEIDRHTQALNATFGQPLNAQTVLGPAVSLLLAYDYSGQRLQGWEAFWQLTDPSNWSETPPPDLAQLDAARAMLARQFEANRPFLPEEEPGG